MAKTTTRKAVNKTPNKAAAKPKTTGADGHVFGRPRPNAGKPKLHTDPPRDTHYRELPPPTGTDPFHLKLASLLPAASINAITKAKKLTFHLNGDLGGIGQPMQQTIVANCMEADFNPNAHASDNPAFMYVVGDCVYYNGQKSKYYAQFYQPYEFYPGPIVAVPGNHDGENLPADDTLAGFVHNFCAPPPPKKTDEAQEIPRTAMVQPNVYWTLVTPLVNIVGLYSNVPEGGDIRDPQKSWLISQLKTLPKNKPLLVALHHPIYSADVYHAGSTRMKKVLEEASLAAGGRTPEMVLAGHVHNYQRITHTQKNGSKTVHLVTGAGGYPNLHAMIKVDGQPMITPSQFDDGGGDLATVEKYSDDHHGFMRLEVTPTTIIGRYFEVPRPQEPFRKGAQLLDYFEFDWKNREYLPNTP